MTHTSSHDATSLSFNFLNDSSSWNSSNMQSIKFMHDLTMFVLVVGESSCRVRQQIKKISSCNSVTDVGNNDIL